MTNREKSSRVLQRERKWLVREREGITKPWRLAIFTLRKQLVEECLAHKAASRHLQGRRLIHNLVTEIKPGVAVKASVMSYWLFCGSPWQDQLGYDQARQQHQAELKALGFPPRFQPLGNNVEIANDLIFRLDSLASWIEAHESWIVWTALNSQRAEWDRNDPIARRQGLHAGIIAKMPTITTGISDWGIARLTESFAIWHPSQWTKVLKMAARVAEQGEQSPDELETWVWWRYPIFGRYHWSAGEVYRAALEKFGERDGLANEAAFQSAWIRRGLRFTGKKRRHRTPPLWDFALHEEVPKDIDRTYSLLTWISDEKSRSKS